MNLQCFYLNNIIHGFFWQYFNIVLQVIHTFKVFWCVIQINTIKKKFKFCKYFESFWNNIKLLLWPSADGKIVGNFFFIFIKSLIVNNPNNIQLFCWSVLFVCLSVCLFVCFPSYNKLSETLSNKNQLQWKPLNVIADNVIIHLIWSNWPKLTNPKSIFSA